MVHPENSTWLDVDRRSPELSINVQAIVCPRSSLPSPIFLHYVSAVEPGVTYKPTRKCKQLPLCGELVLLSSSTTGSLVENYASYAVSGKYTLLLYTVANSVCTPRLVTYEFIITMADAIRIVWKKPVTASAILLGSVQWCTALWMITQLAPPSPNVSFKCLNLQPCVISNCVPMTGVCSFESCELPKAYRSLSHSCKPLSILTDLLSLVGFVQTGSEH